MPTSSFPRRFLSRAHPGRPTRSSTWGLRGGLGLAFALLALPLSGQAGAPAPVRDAEAILEGAARRLAAAGSFCADFVQELRIPLLGETTRSGGRLCQKRPDLFAMDFSEPKGDRVVVDGRWLWSWFPSTDAQQVIRFPLEARGRLDFLEEFVSRPGERYDPVVEGEEAVGGRPSWRIRLSPKVPTGFSGARVWIDRAASLIRRVEIRQDDGSVRIVDLSAHAFDPPIPAGTFVFTPPAGARVFTPPAPRR